MTTATSLRPRPIAWALSAVLAAGLLSACNKPTDPAAPPADAAGPASTTPATTTPPDTMPPADTTPPADMPPPAADTPPPTDIAPANPQPTDSTTTEPDKGKTENPPKQ